MLEKVPRVTQFIKYGLTDESGKVIIGPVFDEVIIIGTTILVKKDGKWGVVKELLEDKINYEFDDVKVYNHTLWFCKLGLWGAKILKGCNVVECKYSSIRELEGSTIIEAMQPGGKVDYFNTKGERLWYGIDISRIEEFISGYAMAIGYEGSATEKFFIVRGDIAGIFSRSFTDMNECKILLNELRQDYVWSINLTSR